MKRPSARRITTLLVTATAALAAASASSAWATPSLTDNGDGTVTASGVSSFGDDGLWICATATPAASCVFPGPSYDYGTLVDGTYEVGSPVFTPTSPGYVPLPAGVYNMNLVNGVNSITLTSVRIGAAPTPEVTGTPAAPDSRHQAFGAPSTGTCDEAADPSLDWGGASAGGWTTSWQQWVNEGAGGAVCQRTLTYSASTGHWVVAP